MDGGEKSEFFGRRGYRTSYHCMAKPSYYHVSYVAYGLAGDFWI